MSSGLILVINISLYLINFNACLVLSSPFYCLSYKLNILCENFIWHVVNIADIKTRCQTYSLLMISEVKPKFHQSISDCEHPGRCVSFTYLAVPVILQHRDDTCSIHQHMQRSTRKLFTAKKKALTCGLLFSSQRSYTTRSFPSMELTLSGLQGARPTLSHYTQFCPHALANKRTLSYTHPWLSCWILALPGLTTCW